MTAHYCKYPKCCKIVNRGAFCQDHAPIRVFCRTSPWDDERSEKLKRWWKEGFTAWEIAEKLGFGCTRNAVIGRANRMGLRKKPTPFKPVEGERRIFT